MTNEKGPQRLFKIESFEVARRAFAEHAGILSSPIPSTQEASIILVIRNPNPYDLERILDEYHSRIKAVIWDGEYESNHWAPNITQDYGVPLLADLDHSLFDKINRGETPDLIFVDSINHAFEVLHYIQHHCHGTLFTKR